MPVRSHSLTWHRREPRSRETLTLRPGRESSRGIRSVAAVSQGLILSRRSTNSSPLPWERPRDPFVAREPPWGWGKAYPPASHSRVSPHVPPHGRLGWKPLPSRLFATGKSFLRVYPLNGDTPGVTHFIGVLERLTGGGATLGAVDPAASAVGDAGGDHPGVGEVRVGGAAGEETSSREAGTSEGETSSDSTSSAGRRNRYAAWGEGRGGDRGGSDPLSLANQFSPARLQVVPLGWVRVLVGA